MTNHDNLPQYAAASFDSGVIERLAWRPVIFEMLHQLASPGNIDHLFFIEEGVASMTATFSAGAQFEVGMFGVESVVGAHLENPAWLDTGYVS